MRLEAAQVFRHPRTGAPLTLESDEVREGEIVSGRLVGEGEAFSIREGVPRFCPGENYADGFGYQWNRFPIAQLDSAARWGGQSEKRLFDETKWPRRMEGLRVLEAGSGMGRFTEVLAPTGAEICTFDLSSAAFVNARNNRRFPNVHFAQADLQAPPFAPGSFDKVLCVGVLQHTPSPRRAFDSLVRFLKPGGEIVVDVYDLSWKCLLRGKYYLRPLTRRLTPQRLHRFVRFHVGWVYPVTGWISAHLGPWGRNLSWVLGVADYRGVLGMGEAKGRELAELDTFDMLAPAYDRPQTLRRVRSWFKEAGLVDVTVERGYNGIVGRGRRH